MPGTRCSCHEAPTKAESQATPETKENEGCNAILNFQYIAPLRHQASTSNFQDIKSNDFPQSTAKRFLLGARPTRSPQFDKSKRNKGGSVSNRFEINRGEWGVMLETGCTVLSASSARSYTVRVSTHNTILKKEVTKIEAQSGNPP